MYTRNYICTRNEKERPCKYNPNGDTQLAVTVFFALASQHSQAS